MEKNYRKRTSFLTRGLASLILVFFFSVSGFSFGSGDWNILNQDSPNAGGEIAFEIERYDGGNRIDHNLYLEYQDPSTFQWIEFVWIEHWKDDGNKYRAYSRNGNSVSFDNYNRDNNGNGSNRYYYVCRWRPDVALANKDIQVRVREENTVKDTRTIKFYAPKVPTDITATYQTECSKIDVEWAEPDNIGDYDVEYYIYRRTKGSSSRSYLGKVTKNSNYTTKDGKRRYKYSNSRTSEVEYEYYVRPKTIGSYTYTIRTGGSKTISNISNYADYENPVTGAIKPKPVKVTGITTEAGCDGNTVKWSYNFGELSKVDHFKIIRYLNNSTSENKTWDVAVNAGNFSFEDTDATPGQLYKYAVVALNDCDQGHSTVNDRQPATRISPIATDLTASLSQTLTALQLSWKKMTHATGYTIERINLSTSVTDIVQIDNGNTTSYIDTDVSVCSQYRYSVKATNSCFESNEATITGVFTANLSSYFTAGDLEGSKGYFGDRIELSWNKNQDYTIDRFVIYRREAIGGSGFTKEETLSADATTWSDRDVQAYKLYEYKIVGESDCASGIIKTNEITTVGFKLQSGIINGRISFKDGSAVQGAEVLVANNDGSQTGKSLEFDGSDDYINIAKTSDFTDEGTVELFFKPKHNGGAKSTRTHLMGWKNYYLYYDEVNKDLYVKFRKSNNAYTTKKLNDADNKVLDDQFNSLVLAYKRENNEHVYSAWLNGVKINSGTVSTHSNMPNANNLSFGGQKSNYVGGSEQTFEGNLDELRFWSKFKSDEEIERDYNRYLSGGEEDLVMYWRMDEGISNNVYDLAHTGTTYHKNEGALLNGPSWSDEVPDKSILAFKGITDQDGNYTVNSIVYNDAGGNFSITPYVPQHEFEPGKQVLFIGEGSSVHNRVDFVDISSYQVTGTVKYKDTDCYVKDAQVNIDGEPVIIKGQPVKTDASGAFSIDVPIGEHIITVEKGKHVFSVGQWPTNGDAFYFDRQITGIEFIDSTTHILSGRIVGGQREGEKEIGFGLSTNNVGVATLKLKSQRGDGCAQYTISSDANTGEYEARILPLKYVVESVVIDNNPSVNFGDQDMLDVSLDIEPTEVEHPEDVEKARPRDPYADPEISEDEIRTYSYHYKRNFIYRSKPSIDVTQADGDPFIGEDKITLYYTDDEGDDASTDLDIDPANNSGEYVFGHPVFETYSDYNAKISIFERYVNNDESAPIAEDRVPVNDGEIWITNDLGKSIDTEYRVVGNAEVIQMAGAEGDTLYTFTAGDPNILADQGTPANSYTSVMGVSVRIGANTYNWIPDHADIFRGIVLGNIRENTTFYTEGPQVVDFILRDPPGSGSSTYLEKGTTITGKIKESLTLGAAYSKNVNTDLVPKIVIDPGPAPGPQTETDIIAENDNEFSFSAGGTGHHEWVETTTTVNRWQTSDGSELVGASSDLFYGKSKNYFYGDAKTLGLVEADLTEQNGGTIPALDPIVTINAKEYRIGLETTSFVRPDSKSTKFIYTQDHIENYLIVDLKRLRNQLFNKYPDVYASEIDASHANYGTNNDDPVWGDLATSEDHTKTDDEDFDGESYVFTYNEDNDYATVDSIRIYNQQIRLWTEALAKNEKEKIESSFNRNVSFSAGQPYSYEYQFNDSHEGGIEDEFEFEEVFKIKTGGEINDAGSTVTLTFKFTQKITVGVSLQYEEATTYGFTLFDDNQGDLFSVDIKDPKSNNGPIFKTIGGQSSCPWEQTTYAKYYQPQNNHILSEGTVRREIPVLTADQYVVENVPENEKAIFTLNLGNATEAGLTEWFGIRLVDDVDGVALKLDGAALSTSQRVFEIQGGQSYPKTLTVEKVADEYEYDDIRVMLFSQCEWDHHTNGGVLVASDTVKLSVRFIPSCPIAEISTLNDLWVFNHDNIEEKQDEMGELQIYQNQRISFGNYGAEFDKIEKISLQYKPKNQSVWYGLKTFYPDLASANDPEGEQLDPELTTYAWNLEDILDGEYDLRTVTFCTSGLNSKSTIITGIVDRKRPHSFGDPQPADGILNIGDEISVSFNETINEGKLTWSNFDMRGILNGGELRHAASILLDGNDDYVEIPEKLNLSSSSFTIEFWTKSGVNPNGTIFSHGNQTHGLSLVFENGQFIVKRDGETISSGIAVTDELWHHWAVTYDEESEILLVYLDGAQYNYQDLTVNHINQPKTYIGKSVANDNFFAGNIHELRIWKSAEARDEIIYRMSKNLSGYEQGLIGYWPMDEAFGTLLEDKARHLHAESHAEWQLHPAGYAAYLDNSAVKIDASRLSIEAEQDFSIEFWFKAEAEGTLFSNGIALGADANNAAWQIKLESNAIVVANAGNRLIEVPGNYINNDWVHLNISVSRLTGINAFINGKLIKSSSERGGEFGGAAVYLGAAVQSISNDGTYQLGDYANVAIDEFRLWEYARRAVQVKRDLNHKMDNETLGLRAYYPFENYQEDAGVNVLRQSFNDESAQEAGLAETIGAVNLDINSAPVKLINPIEKVNFNYVVNNDKILFDMNEAAYRVENATIDVTVTKVEDMQANRMEVAESWSFFVDHNQVKWEMPVLAFDVEKGKAFEHTITVRNSGGTEEYFTIEGAPSWMTLSTTSGVLEAQSEMDIKITVLEGVNAGIYDETLILVTDELTDVLDLDIRVKGQRPDWEVQNDYHDENSMSIIGAIVIDGEYQMDPNDMIAASINGVVKGVAQPEYLEEYDRYVFFMDVYNYHENYGKVHFQIWDDDKGVIHIEVTPTIDFQQNALHGSIDEPVVFEPTESVRISYDMEQGWNWISFNITNSYQDQINTYLHPVSNIAEILKSKTTFDTYYSGYGWYGNITWYDGIQNDQMYMMRMKYDAPFVIQGTPVAYDTPINLTTGWNWIAYLPQENMELNDALARLDAKEGDIIKGKTGFAVYNERLGWQGSLKYMEPGKGYKLKSTQDGVLIYPERGRWSPSAARVAESTEGDFSKFPSNMSVIATLPDAEIEDQAVLRVFVDEELRGICQVSKVNEQSLFFLTIHGNTDGQELKFELENDGEKLDISNELSYVSDNVLGSIETPYELNLRKTIIKGVEDVLGQVTVSPNPFSDVLNIRFERNVSEDVEFTLIDVSAREVAADISQINSTTYKVNTSDLPSGVYFLRIKASGEVHTEKLVKE
ncbi:LamG-like jellyroll fold domain-containing protein [Aureibacter tunicatorum]|uniref:Fibronectin type-III domain-containing protein n=1 Tax=Aureibacter tunicatorum TaxID=866807 RepID=A0AAE4BNZ5_9BACT|nr:LamG-like jellyroll fold domain-containing protein [Aureibacter tunicatorum]MDR6237369.1 hypothetical protein [Aureibacter tunicatorum]BDD06360.1 hypothetical protein AUTU_38430 [Aureibacter tunicatorum]